MLAEVAFLASVSLRRTQASGSTVSITVDPSHVIRRDADRFVGIDLNYIRDSDANRPGAIPISKALKGLGARWLRYPGGEKSDFHRWSLPPYAAPKPTSLSWYAKFPGVRMGFDEMIRTARSVGAEPYIVVGYDRVSRTGLTEDQYLADAVAWVRYSNRVKHYGVRYWEIGNENWWNETATPEAMAKIVRRFSAAMKAVDPTIRVGASGRGDDWWNRFLPEAAPGLDFLVCSLYPVWEWKSYERYTHSPLPDLHESIRGAIAAGKRFATKGHTLPVIVAETNSKDYAKDGWPDDNALGHALVTFDLIGGCLQLPEVSSAMLWTTRWMGEEPAKESIWYAFDEKNSTLPTGRAVELWGRFALPHLIGVDGGSDTVVAYATASADHHRFTVWVVNRGLIPQSIVVRLKDTIVTGSATLTVFSANGVGDRSASIRPKGSLRAGSDGFALGPCPPISISIVQFSHLR